MVANVPGSLLPQTTPGCALCKSDSPAFDDDALSRVFGTDCVVVPRHDGLEVR